MRVNSAKTQLLCIAPASERELSTFITTPEGTHLKSGDNLKILGFYFGRRPDAAEHIEAIKRKFYSRLWLLRHLRNAGIPNLDLLSLYKSMVRPVIEFAAPVYHTLLTATQRGELDRLQARALKIVFGWNTSYKTALECSGTPRVEERTRDLFNRFAVKAAASSRFKRWFPLNKDSIHYTRTREKYYVPSTKTTRLLKNPIYQMRRYLNTL